MQTVVCIDGGVSPRTVCHLMEWHLVEWHLVEFPAQRHPEQLPRSSEELDLPGSSRLGALQLGLTPPPLCSGHAQRTRFGPGSGSGKTDVVKRRFLPAKSFIRVGVTSRGHRFQPRIPPQAPYALTPTTFTANRQQTCLQHCPFSLPALSGCQQRVPGLPPGAMSGWLLLY